MEIKHGPVSALPFLDEMFDLVTAIQTHFFWPDLPGDLREVQRVLKPGGTLVIASAALRMERLVKASNRWSDLVWIEYHSADRLQGLLLGAGYEMISSFGRPGRGWICVLAQRSAQKMHRGGQ